MAYQGRYEKPSGANVAMRAAFVLMCLVILSVYMMGGLLAKYSSTGTDSDDARVAKFAFTVQGAPAADQIVCTAVDNGSSTYTVTIQNQSEVAVHYDLSLKFTSGETAGVSYSFSPAAGDLAVGGNASSTLTFTVDWDEFTVNKTGGSAEVTLNFSVTVNVTQID